MVPVLNPPIATLSIELTSSETSRVVVHAHFFGLALGSQLAAGVPDVARLRVRPKALLHA
jgi:hypothetical protein